MRAGCARCVRGGVRGGRRGVRARCGWCVRGGVRGGVRRRVRVGVRGGVRDNARAFAEVARKGMSGSAPCVRGVCTEGCARKGARGVCAGCTRGVRAVCVGSARDVHGVCAEG